jgi:predicted RND superfamily exporter protein
MKKIADFITKFPWLVIVIVIGITVFMAMGAQKIETQNTHDSELPDNDPIVKTIEELEEVFGDKDIVLFAIENTSGIYNENTLKKIYNISEDLKYLDGIIADEVTSLSTINNIEGSDWGLNVEPVLQNIPKTEQEINKIRQSVESNRLLDGRLVSETGDFTVIIANLEEHYEQTLLAGALFELADKYEGPESIYLAGDPIQQEEIDQGIQGDISKLMPLALLLILIGYFLSFRSAKGVALPFIVVLLSVIWAMGTMGHLGFKMNVVTSAIPLLMIAVSSSYGIHILQRYYDERLKMDKSDAVRFSFKKIVPAIILTGITSAIGSATLLVFKVTSIREFGIITSIGIINIVIISCTVIPSMLMLLKSTDKKKKKEGVSVFDRFLLSLARVAINRRALIVSASVALTLVSIVGLMHVRIGNDFIEYFPPNHRLRNTFEKFNHNLGGASYLDIMIDGNEEDAIKNPELLQKMVDFQAFIEKQEGVGYTSSFADIIRRINKEMHEGKANFETIPESQDLVAQYLLLYSMSGDPGDFNDLVDYGYQRAKIRVMLETTEQDIHKALHANIMEYSEANLGNLASVEFGGDVMFWLAQVKYIVSGKIQNIVLAILVVLLVCVLVFRSFIGGLLSIVPLTISSMLTFGLMGFLGIRLETGTAIITAIGIGIGVDFAIHFLMRFREERSNGNDMLKSTEITMITSGKAIIYDVISNIIGFIVFIFSGFIPLQNFGWLISFTMITVAIGSLLVFPALVSYVNPKFMRYKLTDTEETEKTSTTEEKLEPALVE